MPSHSDVLRARREKTQGGTWKRRTMETPPKRITAERLAEAEREEKFWKMKSVAASLKSEALQLDPGLAEPLGPRQSRSSSLSDAYKSNYMQGLEIAGFRAGLGEPTGNAKPTVS